MKKFKTYSVGRAAKYLKDNINGRQLFQKVTDSELNRRLEKCIVDRVMAEDGKVKVFYSQRLLRQLLRNCFTKNNTEEIYQ
jgi:hypothetical protein